ncbi:MAG: bifunctional 4-hydroxy-2-oxoglutarate aldolase/2-dehydro-3-deoxy-phosphogluconate aldolase [Betaproteobacteria bacterium]|nr:bifunctional 4-hydroxy-2-oxoglutarate aldolase/2-dehydro-3-deoxy-phosphogluconate aldolase [Betaproteobacteria bacterium]
MKPIVDRLIGERVVPVLRLDTAELTIQAGECLLEVGFGSLEITMTTPGAPEVIRHFAQKCLVGAGTVLDERMAAGCIEAGAQFLVAPFVFTSLPKICHEAQRAALIAGFTPTEVLEAHRAGADVVKLFPAASGGGPSHLAAIKAVYPQIVFCPTGGVSLDNMEQYFAAGASFVGTGALVPVAALKRGDLHAVRAHAAAYKGRKVA